MAWNDSLTGTKGTMLIKIARSRLGHWSVGLIMEYLSKLLPVDRLYETSLLLAFRHPRPEYPVHVLIVPKKAIRNFIQLIDHQEEFKSQFMVDLLHCVRQLVIDLDLEQRGYRLIVNGGQYQDVPELHFHLISGSESYKAKPLDGLT